MDLIEKYSSSQTQNTQNNSSQIQQAIHKYLIPLLINPSPILYNGKILLVGLLRKLQDIQYNLKLQINTNIRTIMTQISQMSAVSLLRCKNQDNKKILLRYILKMNQRFNYLNFSINLLNGQIIGSSNIQYSEKLGSQIQYIQQIIEKIFGEKNEIFSFYLNILYLSMSSQSNWNSELSNQTEKIANQFKSYINISNMYAWQIFSPTTHSNNKKQIYISTKTQFMQKTFITKTNSSLSKLSQVIKPITQIHQFKKYNPIQDKAIKQKYLCKTLAERRDGNLINQINVSAQNVKNLISKDQIKIRQPVTNKLTRLIIQKITDQMSKVAVNYQKQILTKLPQSEHGGLAKYYFIPNYNEQTYALRITNLTSIVKYQNYIKNNSLVISVFTKIQLFSQIMQTLRYLRDNQIIFNNLIPQSISIKKGLVIKIHNFTHSYNYKVHAKLNQFYYNQLNQKIYYKPYKTNLPYVNLYQDQINTEFNDQRSDVYSFAVIFYQFIYRKKLFDVRQSKMRVDFQQKFKNLFNNTNIICIQDFQSHSALIKKIFLNLLFRCIQRQKKSFNKTQSNISRNQFYSRPYLDWILISIKLFQNYNEIFL